MVINKQTNTSDRYKILTTVTRECSDVQSTRYNNELQRSICKSVFVTDAEQDGSRELL